MSALLLLSHFCEILSRVAIFWRILWYKSAAFSSTVARRFPFSSVSFVNTSFGESLISSGLMASLIQVSVLIFFPFFRPPWLGSFAKITECFPRLRAQYDLEQTPRTGNQAAWHSLEGSRTLSPASHKFLCICKLLHHEFAGGTSGCFRQQMEEPCEFIKGGSGFRKAPDPRHFLFSCSLQDLVGRCMQWTSWRNAISLKVRGFSVPFYNWAIFLNRHCVSLGNHCYSVVDLKQ